MIDSTDQSISKCKNAKKMEKNFLIWKTEREKVNRSFKQEKSKNALRDLLYDKYVRQPGNYLKRVEHWNGDINTSPKINLGRPSDQKLTGTEIQILKINRLRDMWLGFNITWNKLRKEIEAWQEQFKLKNNEGGVRKSGRTMAINPESNLCVVTDDDNYAQSVPGREETGDSCHFYVLAKDKTAKIDNINETTKVEKDDNTSRRRITFCSETSCRKYSEIKLKSCILKPPHRKKKKFLRKKKKKGIEIKKGQIKSKIELENWKNKTDLGTLRRHKFEPEENNISTEEMTGTFISEDVPIKVRRLEEEQRMEEGSGGEGKGPPGEENDGGGGRGGKANKK